MSSERESSEVVVGRKVSKGLDQRRSFHSEGGSYGAISIFHFTSWKWNGQVGMSVWGALVQKQGARACGFVDIQDESFARRVAVSLSFFHLDTSVSSSRHGSSASNYRLNYHILSKTYKRSSTILKDAPDGRGESESPTWGFRFDESCEDDLKASRMRLTESRKGERSKEGGMEEERCGRAGKRE